MGTAASRSSSIRSETEQGRQMRRQLIGLMRSTTGAATPSMRRALDRSYRSCRQSIEAGLRLGRGNAWSRRWRPFVEKYGPASAGYQAAHMEGSELYTQFVRMLEECQAIKVKYGYQQYQFVRSEQYPHAVPVRFASPLRPDKLPVLPNHLDLDHEDDSYRKPTQWRRHDLWRQMLQRLRPVENDDSSAATAADRRHQEASSDADVSPQLQRHGIDRVQAPLTHQSEPPIQPDAALARAADAEQHTDGSRQTMRSGRHVVSSGYSSSPRVLSSLPPLRRIEMPDQMAVQEALHAP